MATNGGPILTGANLTSSKISKRFKKKHSTSPTGLYTIRVPELGNQPLRLWVDNEYDGGGWVMVMANRGYTAGMNNLKYDDAINKVNYRTGGSNDASNTVSWLKRGFGLSDFNAWVGLKYWKYLAGRKNSGKITVVQIVSTTPVELNDTTNHTYRAEWYFTDFNESTWAMNSKGFTSNLKGSTTPGFYSYHAGYPLTTFDSDNDNNGGNCSTYYNNNPWWYGSCWSGNYFAGGGYQDRPYWNSSGSDNHAYGAVYIK